MSNINIHSIKERSWSNIIAKYYICPKCRIVDSNTRRSESDFPCPDCGHINSLGELYFTLNVQILINLIQNMYFEGKALDINTMDKTRDFKVFIVIIFCILSELLVNLILNYKFDSLDINQWKRKEIFNKNLSINRKIKIFKKYFGLSWNDAVDKISKIENYDYNAITVFYIKMNKKRNRFLHEGSSWAIDERDYLDCIDNIEPLLRLFVSIHNKYIRENT